MTDTHLYRTIWRWHFYAGLFVLPVVIALSISGALYLFKPQIDRWEEREFQGLRSERAVAPHRQVEAAIAAQPGATLLDYRLPETRGDAAMIRVALARGEGVREIFVAPDGVVRGSIAPEDRLMAIVKRIHGELLIGTVGNRMVELTASWAIVMILSGLYLWWPRGRSAAGVIWPRVNRGSRMFWRDLHAVTGFWISGLALLLLLTGLPWTGVWGSAFQALRAEMGWVKSGPAWSIDDQSAPPAARSSGHRNHAAHHGGSAFAADVFDAMVARARAEALRFPVIVAPPGAPGRFGQPGEMVWTIRSDAEAPHARTLRFDLAGQHLLSRERFEDSHIIDQVVGYGIAWHEGRLFGWLNQLIGLLTAAGLVTLAVSGFVMWRRRKPAGILGAPSAVATSHVQTGVLAILATLALLLPVLAISLAGVWLAEKFVLRGFPQFAQWLGMHAD